MTTTNTFRHWLVNNLADSLEDIVNHGADAGYGCITYTRDCVELFDTYGDEIWSLAVEQAEELGYKSVLAMIADFRRVDMASSLDEFKNLMVWFAAEEYARQLVDSGETVGDDN